MFHSTSVPPTWTICFNKTDSESMQYQPLVATVPIIGTHATNMWYAHYQALVAGLFVCIMNISVMS